MPESVMADVAASSQSSPVAVALARLEAWLETMRGPGGYGGPVAHWWQQSLLYTGPGLDWRYEGIITGYLKLWQRTGEERWLEKAIRAGDDLIAGQLNNGHFAASCFEANPATAGTPHEAACDVALLRLALALREASRSGWETYATCAERNLRQFYLAQLWDEEAQAFRDSPVVPTFVPNKAATACEALFLMAEVRGDEAWVTRYALPTLDRVVDHQVRGEALDGAIAQNSFGRQRVEKYFPIYIARCVSALLHGYRWTDEARYLEAALRAMAFIVRWGDESGTFPTVVYADGSANRFPSWIAPLGDVLRAADELRPYGFGPSLAATEARLLTGQSPAGGIRTAEGFAVQAGGKLPLLPDVRDLLPVAGWCDKAFRYLASQVEGPLPHDCVGQWEAHCTFMNRHMTMIESANSLEIRHENHTDYLWRKGEAWPTIASAEFWLR